MKRKKKERQWTKATPPGTETSAVSEGRFYKNCAHASHIYLKRRFFISTRSQKESEFDFCKRVSAANGASNCVWLWFSLTQTEQWREILTVPFPASSFSLTLYSINPETFASAEESVLDHCQMSTLYSGLTGQPVVRAEEKQQNSFNCFTRFLVLSLSA